MSTPHDQIHQWVQANPVVLFMKGTAHQPLCGFSAVVSSLLQKLQIEFLAINVLEDPAIREGIKTYSNWPTIPQLYLKGEFIGGCDIVRDLYQNGELITILESKEISFQKIAS